MFIGDALLTVYVVNAIVLVDNGCDSGFVEQLWGVLIIDLSLK